jgi:hypothetical protein
VIGNSLEEAEETHPHPPHEYFGTSMILILKSAVGEKYSKTSSPNPGEKSSR